MESAQRKRITIIAAYFLIFAFCALAVYSFWPAGQTCFDGVKNQNEEGADCGGVCAKVCRNISVQDLIVEKTGTVPGGVSGQYDFFASISNPNAIFGNRKFEYQVKFLDGSNHIISERTGSDFILPGERKYIIENNFSIPSAHTAELKILNSDWMEFENLYEKPDVSVTNKNYSEISGGTAFSQASGLLKNGSPYDFESISIKIILKDGSGNVIALNSTMMRTVKSGENRDFKAQWPNRFPGSVANMEVQADADMFNYE